MKNAILIHGTCDSEEYFNDEYPSLSNSHWFPWLQKQLLIKGVYAQTPEMPDAFIPDYNKWKKEFERFDVNENTVLVGHSCGGGFLLRWLTENKVKIDKLILVAPWLDPNRSKTTDYFDFEIDQNLNSRVNKIHILVSEDDDSDVLRSVEMIEKSLLGAELHKYKDMGHFTFGAMKAVEFPDLLALL